MKAYMDCNRWGAYYVCAECKMRLDSTEPEGYSRIKHPSFERVGFFMNEDPGRPIKCKFAGTVWKLPTIELEPA